MEKHLRILVIACLLISAVSILFILRSSGEKPKDLSFVSQNHSYSPPVARAEPAKETTVGSPDGKWALKMKEEKGKEDVTYIFWILNLTDGSQKEIFRKTVPTTSTMFIPANTFSPDDKYIFLKETGPGEAHYLVLTASGAPLAKDVLTAEILGLFEGKYPDYKITDVTGWGGVGLIIVNTDNKDGGIGPSFWFDVASRSFIRLGTRFN